MEKINFSECLRRHRRNLELTQREASETTDIPMRTYQALEGGEADPSFENLLKILAGFKSSLEQLLSIPVPKPAPATPGVSELARELTLANDRIAALTAELAAINDQKLVASNEKASKRYQEPPLVTKTGENVNPDTGYHTHDIPIPPEILRALADPKMRDELVADVREMEAEKARLQPHSKRKS